MKNKFFDGFTLAEVLVTLMIIGVIAAVTIPALKKDADQRELATKLKKAFSTLSNATNLIMEDEGPIYRWKPAELNNYYKEHLNVARECPPSSGCNTTANIKFPDGSPDSAYGDNGIMLADGTSIIIGAGYGSIEGYGVDPLEYPKVKATIHIDVNGAQKPNQWGNDRFLFLLIDGKGIVPSGYYSETNCTTQYGCASYVLREGKIK